MIAALIAGYGYLAVFLGTLFEGETVLLAAGFAAHRGLLAWPLVVAVAFVGYSFGVAMTALLGEIQHAEEAALIAILAAGFIVWLWRRRRSGS